MLRFEELPKVNSERWFSLDDLKDEIWKDVPGYENVLRISNYSRVLNIKKGVIERHYLSGSGYYRICVGVNGVVKHLYVHRVMLMTFVENPENKKCADHIDTNRLNNTIANLKWATHKENANNPITKLHRKMSHTHTIFSDKKIAKLNRNGELIRTYNSITEAALDTGLKKCSISNAAHGRMMPNKYGKFYECKTAGGYKWKYV